MWLVSDLLDGYGVYLLVLLKIFVIDPSVLTQARNRKEVLCDQILVGVLWLSLIVIVRCFCNVRKLVVEC